MEALLKQTFAFGNVQVLPGKEATRARIFEKLEAASKDDRLNEKDSVFVFYFSGHGTYFSTSQHGVDEALVPSDVQFCRKSDPTTKHGHAAVITGDDLLPYFQRIAQRCALTVVFDCCHSGRIYRDDGQSRAKMLPPGDYEFIRATNQTKSVTNSDAPSRFSRIFEKKFVHLAACSHTEVAREVNRKDDGTTGADGAFTTALIDVIQKVIDQEGPSALSELSCADAIKLVSHQLTGQSPQLEGSHLLTLFGANVLPERERGFSIKHIDRSDPSTKPRVHLEGGVLQLVVKGLYDVFTAANKRRVGQVQVDTIEPHRSSGVVVYEDPDEPIEVALIRILFDLPCRFITWPSYATARQWESSLKSLLCIRS